MKQHHIWLRRTLACMAVICCALLSFVEPAHTQENDTRFVTSGGGSGAAAVQRLQTQTRRLEELENTATTGQDAQINTQTQTIQTDAQTIEGLKPAVTDIETRTDAADTAINGAGGIIEQLSLIKTQDRKSVV